MLIKRAAKYNYKLSKFLHLSNVRFQLQGGICGQELRNSLRMHLGMHLYLRYKTEKNVNIQSQTPETKQKKKASVGLNIFTITQNNNT